MKEASSSLFAFVSFLFSFFSLFVALCFSLSYFNDQCYFPSHTVDISMGPIESNLCFVILGTMFVLYVWWRTANIDFEQQYQPMKHRADQIKL